MTVRRTVTREELDEPLLSYDDAIERIVGAFAPLAPVSTPLGDVLGLVLAEDLVSADDIPSFDNSAMDGYAVRSADLADGAAELQVGETSVRGIAVKVMTGHPIPDGADAIVAWEQSTTLADDRIRAEGPVASGRFVRARGEDVTAGSTVLRRGTVLGPIEVGVAASIGAVELSAHPRPRVAVLSTGDELVGVDEAVGRGRVRDANGPLLRATATSLGATVTGVDRAGDDPDAIAAALHELGRDADLIVTSGGASVGERDWLRTVLEREGELSFWRVAMRPGKPVALGNVAGVAVIVLPGNPGSVVACSHVVLARAIRRLAGRDPEPQLARGVLSSPLAGDAHRTVVHPVRLDGDVVHPAPARTSQVLSNAAGTDGWVIVAPGGLADGSRVDVELAP